MTGWLVRARIACGLAMAIAVSIGCGDDDGTSIDAAPADAAIADGPGLDAPPPDAAPVFGVPCGEAAEICEAGSSLGCCSPPDGGAEACTEFDGLCTGSLQSCDGPEDCGEIDGVCCDFSFGPTCAPSSECVKKQGGTVICHFDMNCLEDRPHCCAGTCSTEVCP
jgi:hypothetical protein